MPRLTLISFPTCPFVQRAVIALKEKNVEHEVIYIDLANKPAWFLEISPLGKVPVLKVERDGQPPGYVFESAVILEYLEETTPGVKLHPSDPLERAQHRSWIEFASQTLGDNWKFTSAKTQEELAAARAALAAKLRRLETTITGPFFGGDSFSYVDASFAPAFRQLDSLETLVDTELFEQVPKVAAWRRALAQRPSVVGAVPANFTDLYLERLKKGGAEILKSAA
ncbi:MAG: glutathione S-transferase family protein [Devosia sp.]|nr:glutathione S-transferase family protein [Devosia sp.]